MTEKERYGRVVRTLSEEQAKRARIAGLEEVARHIEGTYSITAPQMYRILRKAAEEERNSG